MDIRKTGIRTFDFRALIAFAAVLRLGPAQAWARQLHATPEWGRSRPIYFMLLYIHRRTLVLATPLLRSVCPSARWRWQAISGPAGWFDLWMAFVNGGGLMAWRPVDAPELRHGRARRDHPPTAAAAHHGGAERAAVGRGAGVRQAEATHRRHRRQSRRPYRDAVEGGLRRGGQGLCRQEAANHGDRDRGGAGRRLPAMLQCCRKSSEPLQAAKSRRNSSAQWSFRPAYPLAARGRFCATEAASHPRIWLLS